MSESKHTPGPWTVDGPAHNQIVWSSPEERVCFLAHSNGDHPARDFANGRLIAAAPDLLDALKQISVALSGGGLGAISKAWKSVDAAISKAEGRP